MGLIVVLYILKLSYTCNSMTKKQSQILSILWKEFETALLKCNSIES